jgi:hypothetical protein
LTPELLKKRKHVIVGLYSSLVLVLLAPVSVYIHETGHLIICAAGGSSYSIMLNIFGGTLHCSQKPANELLFLSFGGIFAMTVLAVPLVVWKRISKHMYLVIPLLSLIAGHGSNSFIESFLNSWYLENIILATIILNAIVAATFFLLFYQIELRKKS